MNEVIYNAHCFVNVKDLHEPIYESIKDSHNLRVKVQRSMAFVAALPALGIASAVGYGVGALFNFGKKWVESSQNKIECEIQKTRAELHRAQREHDLIKENQCLEQLKNSHDKALKEQQKGFDEELARCKKDDQAYFDEQRRVLEEKQRALEKETRERISKISNTNSAERATLLQKLRDDKKGK